MEHTKNDPKLDPLRTREDFAELLRARDAKKAEVAQRMAVAAARKWEDEVPGNPAYDRAIGSVPDVPRRDLAYAAPKLTAIRSSSRMNIPLVKTENRSPGKGHRPRPGRH